jgi:hypothetical protein
MKSTSLRAQLHDIARAEMLLIRAGQHLFLEWRRKGRGDSILEESFETIWRLKREVRLDKAIVSAKVPSRAKRKQQRPS